MLYHSAGATNTASAIDIARQHIFLPLQEQQENNSSSQSSRINILMLLTDGKSNEPNTYEIYAAINRIKQQVKGI